MTRVLLPLLLVLSLMLPSCRDRRRERRRVAEQNVENTQTSEITVVPNDADAEETTGFLDASYRLLPDDNAAPDEKAPQVDVLPLWSAKEARDDALPRAEVSAWARFPVGAWARLRTVTRALENGKSIESVTETRVLLESVDLEKKEYTLVYAAAVILGDVSIPRPSERRVFNFWDMLADEDERVEEGPSTTLLVDGRAIPCRTLRIFRNSDRVHERVSIWYSPVVYPYVLQKEIVKTAPSSQDKKETTISRELFVVDSIGDPENSTRESPSYTTRFSVSSAGRDLVGSALRAQKTPGEILRERSSEKSGENDAASFESETTLVDYWTGE
ncbi:MAG: hypothetical protein ACI4NV_04250 [Thermoguttaceae bacterium]